MTFANIALKSVYKKFQNYLIYFVSTTFSVLIFNLFCSMYYNPTFEKYRFGTGKMSVLFKGSAIAVFLFAAVFVMYSGSYFLKTQKKEIAIYSLLGMRKGKIAFMMFLETFFIGLLAVVCGGVAGTFSAGYAVSILLRFMAESTNVTFSIEPKALLVTMVAFTILFALSGIRAYGAIYKYSFINLISAEKQSERIPRFSYVGVIIAVFCLITGYSISVLMDMDVGGLHLLKPTLVSGGCILIGTYLSFRNLIPMIIAMVKENMKFYYKSSNFIGVSQVAFRLKGNSRMFSVIALLTALTITMVSASYSFYGVVGGEGSESYAPYSYLAKNIDSEQNDRILKTIKEVGEVELVLEDKIELLNVKIQNEQYAVKDQQTGEATPGLVIDSYILPESKYLQIISETHTPKGKLSETRTNFEGRLDDTECFFIDGNAIVDYCKNLKGESIKVSSGSTVSSYTVTGVSLHKYIGALDLYKHPTIVVNDNVYKQYYSKAASEDIETFYGFQFDDDMRSGSTVDAINQFIPARFHLGGLPENMSYIGIYKANFALFGSYAFIGFFLGILFLLASGSIMYYKIIMEAQEEAPRYKILRKVGMKKSEIVISVIKQVGLVYGIPLFVGLLHTFFGLWVYIRALGEMSQQTSAFQNAAIVVLFYILLYGVFYLLSVRSYYKIVC